jgi:uncharacterized protein YgfB (UPF0149 family)
MSSILNYTDLAALLARLGCADEASAFHGALCGALCRMQPEEIDPGQLLEDPDPSLGSRAREELSEILEQIIESLTDADLGFTPLLPDDDIDLADRAQALSAWCEGFLFGLSGQTRLDLEGCSEEVREIVRDLSELTRAGLSDADDLDVEEGAYAELVEYVRVGAQLVYMELRPRTLGGDEAAPTIH